MNDEIEQLKQENLALKEEVDRLRQYEPSLVKLALENGTLDVHLKCTEIMSILADLYIKWLESQGAENYTETSASVNSTKFSARFGHEILITIQKLSRPTPHELRRKAEEQCNELANRIAELEREVAERKIPSTAFEGLENELTTLKTKIAEVAKYWPPREGSFAYHDAAAALLKAAGITLTKR